MNIEPRNQRIFRLGGALFAMALFLSGSAFAQDGGADEAQLLSLLDDFLAGASISDPAVHERFWAEDLVYTSSRGERFGKAEIMAGLENREETASEATTRYWAEEAQVKLFGDTAVVAFRLMAETRDTPGADPRAAQLFNTGTFVRRGGEWRVVAWQSTVIPESS